jgi:hypothetical protein
VQSGDGGVRPSMERERGRWLIVAVMGGISGRSLIGTSGRWLIGTSGRSLIPPSSSTSGIAIAPWITTAGAGPGEGAAVVASIAGAPVILCLLLILAGLLLCEVEVGGRTKSDRIDE